MVLLVYLNFSLSPLNEKVPAAREAWQLFKIIMPKMACHHINSPRFLFLTHYGELAMVQALYWALGICDLISQEIVLLLEEPRCSRKRALGRGQHLLSAVGRPQCQG